MALTARPADEVAREPSSPPGHQRGLRPTHWVLPVALLVTLVPFAVAAGRMMAAHGGSFQFAGDQAIIGLSARDAGHFDQLLGPYSRYGWSHPGPTWFYLLAPFYWLLGADDAALAASNIIVQGLVAAAIVVVVHRSGRPTLTVVVAGIVLLYVLRMPASFFVQVWNPFALMLATALFLLLVARARDGRVRSLLLVLIVGSYLVQTHVGTGLLVAAGGVTGVVAFVLGRRQRRRADAPWLLTSGLAVVLVLMWVPPVYQELTVPFKEGNLGRVAYFFLTHGDAAHPTIFQAVVAAGRMLAMAPYGWAPGPLQMDASTLPSAVALGLAVQVVASSALVAAGRAWHVPAALWTGVATLVAFLAAVASARTVSGELYWYLLTWISVLPAVTLIGIAQLLLDRPAPAGAFRRLVASTTRLSRATPVLAVATVLVTVGAAGVAVSLSRAAGELAPSPGVQAVSRLVGGALRGHPVRTAAVDIQTHDLWPIGAGLVNDLAEEGWTVRVGRQSAALFGYARVRHGYQPVDVVVIAETDPRVAAYLAGGMTRLGTVDTELGRTTILLRASSAQG